MPNGHIFRTFNIMEYKGPDDSLSVNDFYKVYAYACIFKSDSTETIFPAAGELTITMVSDRYSGKSILENGQDNGELQKKAREK